MRHPDRVSHLIIHGGYAQGWARRGEEALRAGRALAEIVRVGWGADTPAFRRLFLQEAGTGEHERERLVSVLRQTNWNKMEAARQMNWSRMTLYRKLAKYNLDHMDRSDTASL